MRVTVIITAYNYGRFIQEAIQSVLAQTTTADLQIVVVDDGSTDETPDEALGYSGARLSAAKIWQCLPSSGPRQQRLVVE